ncbi:hypothetical protein [Paraburkholderia fungorum]
MATTTEFVREHRSSSIIQRAAITEEAANDGGVRTLAAGLGD